MQITVLKSFTEVRTGVTYAPGEVITHPLWHAPDDRKAAAYAARGYIRIEEAPPAPPGKPIRKRGAKED